MKKTNKLNLYTLRNQQITTATTTQHAYVYIQFDRNAKTIDLEINSLYHWSSHFWLVTKHVNSILFIPFFICTHMHTHTHSPTCTHASTLCGFFACSYCVVAVVLLSIASLFIPPVSFSSYIQPRRHQISAKNLPSANRLVQHAKPRHRSPAVIRMEWRLVTRNVKRRHRPPHPTHLLCHRPPTRPHRPHLRQAVPIAAAAAVAAVSQQPLNRPQSER